MRLSPRYSSSGLKTIQFTRRAGLQPIVPEGGRECRLSLWQRHPPQRRAALTAARSNSTPDSLDVSLSLHPSAPSPVPVETALRITSVLEAIRTLLQDEIWGSELWIRRVATAIEDVKVRRRGLIGGRSLVSLAATAQTFPQYSVTALLHQEISSQLFCKTRWKIRTNHGQLCSHDTLIFNPRL